MNAFLDFMASPAGVALYCIVAAAIVIFFLAVNYRFFAKRLLDLLFGALAVIITLPLLGICAAVCRSRCGRAFDRVVIAGRRCEPVTVRVFCKDGGLGALSRLPCLLSVVTGGLSFVGPAMLEYKDINCVPEDCLARFDVRPGMLAACSGQDGAAPIAADCRYPETCSLWRDTRTVAVFAFRALRGEGSDG